MQFKKINESFRNQYKNIIQESITNTKKDSLSKILDDAIEIVRISGQNDLTVYEVALQTALEKEFPDKAWYEVTSINIKDDLWNTQSPELVKVHILNNLICNCESSESDIDIINSPESDIQEYEDLSREKDHVKDTISIRDKEISKSNTDLERIQKQIERQKQYIQEYSDDISKFKKARKELLRKRGIKVESFKESFYELPKDYTLDIYDGEGEEPPYIRVYPKDEEELLITCTVQNIDKGPFKSFDDIEFACFDQDSGNEYEIPNIPVKIQKEFLVMLNEYIEENPDTTDSDITTDTQNTENFKLLEQIDPTVIPGVVRVSDAYDDHDIYDIPQYRIDYMYKNKVKISVTCDKHPESTDGSAFGVIVYFPEECGRITEVNPNEFLAYRFPENSRMHDAVRNSPYYLWTERVSDGARIPSIRNWHPQTFKKAQKTLIDPLKPILTTYDREESYYKSNLIHLSDEATQYLRNPEYKLKIEQAWPLDAVLSTFKISLEEMYPDFYKEVAIEILSSGLFVSAAHTYPVKEYLNELLGSSKTESFKHKINSRNLKESVNSDIDDLF